MAGSSPVKIRQIGSAQTQSTTTMTMVTAAAMFMQIFFPFFARM